MRLVVEASDDLRPIVGMTLDDGSPESLTLGSVDFRGTGTLIEAHWMDGGRFATGSASALKTRLSLDARHACCFCGQAPAWRPDVRRVGRIVPHEIPGDRVVEGLETVEGVHDVARGVQAATVIGRDCSWADSNDAGASADSGRRWDSAPLLLPMRPSCGPVTRRWA